MIAALQPSTKADIINALKRVNLDGYFKDVFCYNEIGFSKPSKQYFDYILNKLNVERKHVIMIGDDYEKDYLGAKENGISALLYTPSGENSNDSAECVKNLIDVLTIVDSQEV